MGLVRKFNMAEDSDYIKILKHVGSNGCTRNIKSKRQRVLTSDLCRWGYLKYAAYDTGLNLTRKGLDFLSLGDNVEVISTRAKNRPSHRKINKNTYDIPSKDIKEIKKNVCRKQKHKKVYDYE